MVKILTEKIQSIFPNKLFFAFIRPISPVIKENNINIILILIKYVIRLLFPLLIKKT